MSDRLKGYLITLAGVLIITPDALLLRLITSDIWTIMFYRGLGFFLVLFVILGVRYRRKTLTTFHQTGYVGLAVVVSMTLGQNLFVYSIHHTQAANTLVILAAIPLATAAIAWLWLGEAVGWRTVVSGLLVLFAVGLTMTGGVAIGGTQGDLAALGAMIAFAFLLAALRRTPELDLLPAIAGSGLLTAAIAWVSAESLDVASTDLLLLAVLCLFVSPISFALISIGPRYLPAPEVALLLLVETALGPFWVYLVLAETPGMLTLAGGALMIATLAVNSWLLLRAGTEK